MRDRNAWPILFLGIVSTGALVAFTGCSPILNSLTGLTTSQSAISGSNYLFTPNREDCLTARSMAGQSGRLIGPGDSFAVTLDFGFVRYFQAVDPYVIGYGASWMGANPSPSDPEKMNQQLLFKREGLGENGRLALTAAPLLGPVTMGKDGMPVTVAVKIVTLSRYDNAQSITLLNQLSGAIAAAQPQYAAAAQVAGALAGAIVAQNRDKLEFEHTFTFWPAGSSVPPSDEHLTNLELRVPTRYVVIKGENETRNIPYQNWYFYLWPFNWLGHSPSSESRRFESEKAWRYCSDVSDIVRGDDKTTWPRAVPWFLGCTVRAPLYLIGDIFIAGQLDTKTPTDPTHLRLDSDYLSRNRACGAEEPDAGWRVYSEKTHMAISVVPAQGSYGDFQTLISRMSEQAKDINDLTTNRAEWEALSTKQQQAAFDQIKNVAVAKAAEGKANSDIDKGVNLSAENFCSTGLDCDARTKLVEQAIDKQVRRTIDQYVSYASKYVRNAKADEKTPYDPSTLMPALEAFISNHNWGTSPNTKVGEWDCKWHDAWELVLDETYREVKTNVEPKAGTWTLPRRAFGACAPSPTKCAPC